MTVTYPEGDLTFFGVFEPPTATILTPAAPRRIVIPELATLCAMTVDELEALLVDIKIERSGRSREEVMAGPMLDGSLRTQSLLMVDIINQIGHRVGRALLRPSDLDDARQLRSVRGAAMVFKAALARLPQEVTP